MTPQEYLALSDIVVELTRRALGEHKLALFDSGVGQGQYYAGRCLAYAKSVDLLTDFLLSITSQEVPTDTE